MRILHTGDWHLGRTLHGVDLLDAQAAYLDHLVELAADDVGAVIVAGDVYDRAIPPIEAVRLLESTLARLTEVTTVVVLSGNHDSATRLGFGASLYRDRLRVRTDPAEVGRPVELADAHGAVVVHPLPFLDPDTVRHDFGTDGEPTARSHEAVLSAAMDRVRTDLAARPAGTRSVVAAHAFVVGGEPSDSERDIRVGGVDSVPAGVFRGVDYVALGHLHGQQAVGSVDGTVLRYSGSPLAYSFSEAGHRKSTTLVTLGAEGVDAVELLPAPVPRRLVELRGTLDELLDEPNATHRDAWVKVVVTDQHRPADLHARVRAVFEHALVVEHRPAVVEQERQRIVITAASDPIVVMDEFVEHVTGLRPDATESAVLRSAHEAALTAAREA